MAPAGNAATRLEPFVTRDGFYSYSVIPEAEDLFIRQSREMDRKKREAMFEKARSGGNRSGFPWASRYSMTKLLPST